MSQTVTIDIYKNKIVFIHSNRFGITIQHGIYTIYQPMKIYKILRDWDCEHMLELFNASVYLDINYHPSKRELMMIKVKKVLPSFLFPYILMYVQKMGVKVNTLLKKDSPEGKP